MKSAADRLANYTAKTVATTVGLKIAANLPTMKSEFSAAIQSLAPVEQQIQGILNGEATVPVVQYPFYLSFGRELWALGHKGIAGDAALTRSATILGKWDDMGLENTILKKIALDVFNMTIP
jgi:hypothetical protein